MKRFVSVFLLCLILPFMLFPINANAYSVQGTDFPDVSFLPPDIDFEKYPYYFLVVIGSPEKPSYYLYTLLDNGQKHGRVYFSVTEKSSSTAFHTSEYTAYGITTDYHDSTNETAVKGIRYFSYSSDGSWNSSGNSDSTIKGWAFDGYSDFSATSGTKYIVASNVDIYDYSGVLIRKADYSNLCSFFKNNLQGSSEASGGSSSGSGSGDSGGGSSVNLDFIKEDLKNISLWLSKVYDSLDSVMDIISKFGSSDVAETEIVDWLSNIARLIPHNFEQFTAVFNEKTHEIDLHITKATKAISDFQELFFDFSAVGGEVKNLANLFSEIHISISNLMHVLKSTVESIGTDFNDFAEKVISKLNRIISLIDDVDFSVKFNTLNVGFVNLKASVDSLIDDLNLKFGDINNYFGDVKNSIDDIKTNVENDFESLISAINNSFSDVNTNLVSISSAVINGFNDVETKLDSLHSAIQALPDSFSELLEYLFIPQEDHFTGIIREINKHFGFVRQIVKLGDVLLSEDAEFDTSEPSYVLDVDSDTYGHFTADIVDFSVVASQVPFVKALISGIVLYFSIRRWRKRLPDIINGTGGD